ncbi:MAG TPA: hypothetical protein VMV91_11735, partial [Rhodocyclaceae bacterium]|nr:hypothetical protein [Rhodocyclaceae bacterium]
MSYVLGPGVARRPALPYRRVRGDPVYRPLRIYAVDPATPAAEGQVALVLVAYEPLAPGPVGALFAVDNEDGSLGLRYRRADLDDPLVLIRDGYDPCQSDPRFHQQMVYAVACSVAETFRSALGRNIAWGFEGRPGEPARLLLQPHAFQGANAYYDKGSDGGRICFGYYRADSHPTDRVTLPGGYVFSCLSHDVIAHELTHAILDGLRAHFATPTSADVVAFHEAFADLVALFQHFTHAEVVRAAIRASRGDMERSAFLADLACQIGHTSGNTGGRGAALRSALDRRDAQGMPTQGYDEALEAHELGAVLVAAVFEAFATVFRRKTERYLRLASGGTGVFPPGELPLDLQGLLAESASRLAGHFLAIAIRAVDYCPPAGLRLGDYLRAMITADHDLLPDDPWGYREALVDAFRRRNVYPVDVANLSEDALLWRGPVKRLDAVPGLKGLSCLEPGSAELARRARALGEFVTRPEHLDEFGLVASNDPRLAGDEVGLPVIASIRQSLRAAPDGQVAVSLVAEVIQERRVGAAGGAPAFCYHGGS